MLENESQTQEASETPTPLSTRTNPDTGIKEIFIGGKWKPKRGKKQP